MSRRVSTFLLFADTMLLFLRTTFHRMFISTSNFLYKTLVCSLLQYCNPAWSVNLFKNIYMLEVIQQRATRLSYQIVRPSYKERMKNKSVTSFAHRRLIVFFRLVKKWFNQRQSVQSQ